MRPRFPAAPGLSLFPSTPGSAQGCAKGEPLMGGWTPRAKGAKAVPVLPPDVTDLQSAGGQSRSASQREICPGVYPSLVPKQDKGNASISEQQMYLWKGIQKRNSGTSD